MAKTKTPRKKTTSKLSGEAGVLAAIAAMRPPSRGMGERLHALIMRTAPALTPKLFYGMPGYAKDGPVICFFRADKYMTFGLTEKANFSREAGVPDQLMASAWFFAALDDATEARLAAIIRHAASEGPGSGDHRNAGA